MRHPYSLIATLLLAGPAAIADTPSDNAEAAPAAVQAPAEAAQPAAPTTASPAAPAAAAPAAPAPAAATPANDATTLKMADAQVDPEFVPPPGFKKVTNGVNVTYCTTMKPTGSNLPQRYCMTKEQVIDYTNRQEAARRDIKQKSMTCTGNCGGS